LAAIALVRRNNEITSGTAIILSTHSVHVGTGVQKSRERVCTNVWKYVGAMAERQRAGDRVFLAIKRRGSGHMDGFGLIHLHQVAASRPFILLWLN